MTRLGIVAALPAEAKCLVDRQDDNRDLATAPLLQLHQHVILKVSGMGPEFAQSAATDLIEHGATALLSWGCAGALSVDMQPGALLLPQAVITADGQPIRTDQAWRARLAQTVSNAVSVHDGILAESRTILFDPAQKHTLHQAHGAVATDMESAAVGRAARAAGIPFLAVRAVADTAADSLPLFVTKAMDEFGRIHVLRLLRALIGHPASWLQMIRLERHFHAAMRTLRMISGQEGPLFHIN